MTHHSHNQGLIIERLFSASRAKVWKAWTIPDQVKRWWGPKDFTTPFAEIDLRVGGKYLFLMLSSEGKEYWTTGTYREIVPLEKIVATDCFSYHKGNVVPASNYGMNGDWPLELIVTVTFEDQDNGMKMTLNHVGIPAGENREMAFEGWNQSFDKLAHMLR